MAGSGGLVSLDLGEALTGFVVVRERLQQQVHGEQSSPERMEKEAGGVRRRWARSGLFIGVEGRDEHQKGLGIKLNRKEGRIGDGNGLPTAAGDVAWGKMLGRRGARLAGQQRRC